MFGLNIEPLPSRGVNLLTERLLTERPTALWGTPTRSPLSGRRLTTWRWWTTGFLVPSLRHWPQLRPSLRRIGAGSGTAPTLSDPLLWSAGPPPPTQVPWRVELHDQPASRVAAWARSASVIPRKAL